MESEKNDEISMIQIVFGAARFENLLRIWGKINTHFFKIDILNLFQDRNYKDVSKIMKRSTFIKYSKFYCKIQIRQ